MICNNCRAEISDNSNFCTYCGTAQDNFADASNYLAGTPGHSAGAPRYLDLGKLLGDTFEFYKQHFGTMCLVGVLLYGIPVIINICGSVSQFAATTIGKADGPVPLVVSLLGLNVLLAFCQPLAQWYLTLGAVRQCLYVARGGVGFRADLMFPPFMMFLKMIGLMLVVALVTLGFMLPGTLTAVIGLIMLNPPPGEDFFDPSLAVPLIVIGVPLFILGLCATVWISIRWYLAYVFIADQNTGIIDSMTYSWRISLGNFWILLLAAIVLGICSMVGMVLCCVGIVLTIAVSMLGAALAYLQLTGQPNYLDYATTTPFVE